MATLNLTTTMTMTPAETATSYTFPFLALPPEIRCIIYQLVFSQRTVILGAHLVRRSMPERSHWQYHQANSRSKFDSTTNLLRTCKNIHAEAQPLLSVCVPSHLVLSRDLRRLPVRYKLSALEYKVGLPLRHIIKLSLDVKCLGGHKQVLRACPMLTTPAPLAGAARPPEDLVPLVPEVDGPPPEPKRLPGLGGIRNLSILIREGIPALRELHIYDALRGRLDPPQDACSCPIAPTASCHCGKCECICVRHPPFPQSRSLSLTETACEMHNALQLRYRAALPRPVQSTWIRGWFDFFTVLNLLLNGVHVYLHDAMPVSVSIGSGNAVHKGYWRARYYLRPPEDATQLADLPSELVEGPRHATLVEYRIARASIAVEGTRACEATERRMARARIAADLLDPGCATIQLLRDLAEWDLAKFEAELKVEVMDEHIFDCVVDRESREVLEQLRMADKDKSLWVWD